MYLGKRPWNEDYSKELLYNFSIHNTAKTDQQIKDYHNKYASQVALFEDFRYAKADGTTQLPAGWTSSTGSHKTNEDSTGKYIECVTSGVVQYKSVDLSGYEGNGYIFKIDGDFSSDVDKTVDSSTNVSFANNTVSVTMTSGQKLRNIGIQKGVLA